MKFTDFVTQTQYELIEELKERFYHAKQIHVPNAGLFIQGEAPVLLVAHLDTVHTQRVKTINYKTQNNKHIISSPQGIGGDDRCGVYGMIKAYEESKIKPHLLFTHEEEIGCVGSRKLLPYFQNYMILSEKELQDLKCIIQIDRQGAYHGVYYDCDNKRFESYIKNKGFSTQIGSYSDIAVLAPTLGVAAVNLASGYYNPHQTDEFVVLEELEDTIALVKEIIAESVNDDFPKYEYIQAKYVMNPYDESYEFIDPIDYLNALELQKLTFIYDQLANDIYELEWFEEEFYTRDDTVAVIESWFDLLTMGEDPFDD